MLFNVDEIDYRARSATRSAPIGPTGPRLISVLSSTKYLNDIIIITEGTSAHQATRFWMLMCFKPIDNDKAL